MYAKGKATRARVFLYNKFESSGYIIKFENMCGKKMALNNMDVLGEIIARGKLESRDVRAMACTSKLIRDAIVVGALHKLAFDPYEFEVKESRQDKIIVKKWGVETGESINKYPISDMYEHICGHYYMSISGNITTFGSPSLTFKYEDRKIDCVWEKDKKYLETLSLENCGNKWYCYNNRGECLSNHLQHVDDMVPKYDEMMKWFLVGKLPIELNGEPVHYKKYLIERKTTQSLSDRFF